MRQLWAGLVLALTLACGGSGGSGGSGSSSPQYAAPTLSNFTLSPDTATQSPYGTVTFASVVFSAPAGDLASATVTLNGQPQVYSLDSFTGQTSGTLTFDASIDTTQVGTATLAIKVSTSHSTTSNEVSQTFTVTPAPSTVTSVSPASVEVGGQGFTLTVSGSNFEAGSQVLWNSTALPTTYVSSTSLQAAVAAGALAVAGTAQVAVSTPGLGTTTALPFTIADAQVLTTQLVPNDIVWDPVHQVIYASLPSTAGTDGNTIAVVDPKTGQVTTSVFAGSEPTRLALSGDAGYLYAGINGSNSVQRFILPSLAKDILIPLGSSGSYGPNVATALQVMPGAPNTVAVLMTSSEYSMFGGLTIFDDLTPRPNVLSTANAGYSAMNDLQWSADGTAIFAIGYQYDVLAVNAGGITLQSSVNASYTSAQIHLDPANGDLYLNSGQVLNPVTGQQLGVFQKNGPMVPDSALDMAFFVDSSSVYSGSLNLCSFNLDQFTPIGTFSIPTATSYTYTVPTRLIRFGGNGLALCGGNFPLTLVSGPWVLGQ